MLEHGGGILAAAARYGIPPQDWLDLSTGINPLGWPVPPTPADCWRRLPEAEDGLVAAARAYYGAMSLLPVAGSQAALQVLPLLRSPSTVGVLAPTYAEHPKAWEQVGHRLKFLDASAIDGAVDSLDALVLANPNNPSGEHFPRERLEYWLGRMIGRGGWLVVDEAFMDAAPGASLAPLAGIPGLVVLRSLGKFFGLAGARVGFVLAWPELLAQLEERLGPWTVAGPARWAAKAALTDTAWQAAAREALPRAGGRLKALLSRHGLAPAGGTALFQWVPTPAAASVQEHLAHRGIWVRRFESPSALRFGLPGGDEDWQRLEAALGSLP
ncbi:MAG: threonine-phosphate decarboxylase CobD [Sulfuricellaceae bacterium]|jgi:cobalamin biosynthetic protein CobC